MKILLAYKTYKALDSEQKQLIQVKTIEASRTPADWLTFLQKVSEFDRIGDGARSAAGKIGGVFAVLALVFLFAPAMSSFIGGIFYFSVEAILLFIAIFNGVAYFRLKKNDLPNRLRQFIVPVISVLREDMDANESLNLKMDLRGPTIPEKEHDELPGEGGYPSVTITNFIDPWFSGTASLADGSALNWQATDYVRRRKIKKRNSRGKIKYKTKYKVQTVIDTRLGLRSESYTPQTSTTDSEVVLKAGEKKNQLRVRRGVESTDPNAIPDFEIFLSAVTDAYKQVKVNKA